LLDVKNSQHSHYNNNGLGAEQQATSTSPAPILCRAAKGIDQSHAQMFYNNTYCGNKYTKRLVINSTIPANTA